MRKVLQSSITFSTRANYSPIWICILMTLSRSSTNVMSIACASILCIAIIEISKRPITGIGFWCKYRFALVQKLIHNRTIVMFYNLSSVVSCINIFEIFASRITWVSSFAKIPDKIFVLETSWGRTLLFIICSVAIQNTLQGIKVDVLQLHGFIKKNELPIRHIVQYEIKPS